jgi:hypothetical protein
MQTKDESVRLRGAFPISVKALGRERKTKRI